MAISNDDAPLKIYEGDGSTDTYAYDWKITDKTHLFLSILDEEGDEDILIVDSDYTVTGVGDEDGGTIVLDDGNLADGAKLRIASAVPNTQPTVFPRQGSWDPKTVEGRLDAIVRQIQQLAEGLGRSYKVERFLAPPDPIADGDLLIIAEETAARIAADLAEAAARIAADNALAQDIADEADARADADAILAAMSWGGQLDEPQEKVYVLEQFAPCPGTIIALKAQGGDGDGTVTIAIDGTPVTGLDEVDLDDTAKSFTATAANTFAAGARITYEFSDLDGLIDLGLTVLWTKTLS